MKIVDIYHQHRTIVLLYKLHFIEYLISCRNITSLPKSNVPKKVVAQFKTKMHDPIISIVTVIYITIYKSSFIIYMIQSRSLILHYLISSFNRWLPIILHNYYKLYISSNMKISSWHIEHYLFYPDRLTHEYPFLKASSKLCWKILCEYYETKITSTINLFYSILIKANKPTTLLPYQIRTYYLPYPYIFTKCSTSHQGKPSK